MEETLVRWLMEEKGNGETLVRWLMEETLVHRLMEEKGEEEIPGAQRAVRARMWLLGVAARGV